MSLSYPTGCGADTLSTTMGAVGATRVTVGISRVVTVVFPCTVGGFVCPMASEASASARPRTKPVRRRRMGDSLQNMAKAARYLKLLALAASVNGGGGGDLGTGRPTPCFLGVLAGRKLRDQPCQIAFRLLFAPELS